ncbi:MAG TPA: superoxide dismutase family protein [Bacteroidetes bacterium]|nr:superoxide dismutase family protein [Bacteroidota bacterium]
MLKGIIGFILAGTIALFAGCKQEVEEVVAGPQVEHAIVVLNATEGNTVSGVVEFRQTEGGVRVSGEINGLPAGEHGFHVHQYGDCSGSDGKTAGGHFNPEGMEHGGPAAEKRHIGDLGNITADEAGIAKIDFVDKKLSLNGPNSIIGRGVIVHEKADDMTSQPTGAAGARLACGVIGIAK